MVPQSSSCNLNKEMINIMSLFIVNFKGKFFKHVWFYSKKMCDLTHWEEVTVGERIA